MKGTLYALLYRTPDILREMEKIQWAVKDRGGDNLSEMDQRERMRFLISGLLGLAWILIGVAKETLDRDDTPTPLNPPPIY